MNWLGASVRLRLIVLCIGLFVAFCLSSVLLLYLIDRMRDDQLAQSEQERRLSAIADVGSAITRWRHHGGRLTEAELTHQIEEQRSAQVAYEQSMVDIRTTLDRLAEFDPDSEQAITIAVAESPALSEKSVKLYMQGRQDESIKVLQEVQSRMDLVERTLSDASKRERERTMDTQRRGAERSTLGLRIAIVIIILTAISEILLILTVARSILRPLRVTSAAIRQVNSGELAIDLPPIRADEFGEMAQAVRHFRDRAEKLQRLAYQDSLTGLGNRAQLGESLERTLELYAGTEKAVALLFFDVDRFRAINERLGNTRGDRYLCEIANRLSRFMPESGTLFRHGGNRFVMMMEDLVPSDSRLTDLQRVAESMLRSVSEPFAIGSEVVMSSMSVGIGISPEDGNNSEQLIGSAEAALHTAKRAGRNKIRFAGGQQTSAMRRRATLATDIARGLDQGEFDLFYQPIIDYADRRVIAGEGLVRWHHPHRGLLNAGEFIDVAEEEGLITRIGEHCLRLAHDQVRDWQKRGINLRLAVNVSAQQLQEDRLLRTLRELRAENGLAAGLIDLELTESTLFDHSDQTRAILEEIKRLGYRLGLDDFGTGYSSLSYIQRLPIDKIKIDRQFVATMDNRPQALAVVTAILSLAKALHLEVIAEGVETEGQAARLLEVDCTLQQGFFYSRALPVRDFEKWVGAFETRGALVAG